MQKRINLAGTLTSHHLTYEGFRFILYGSPLIHKGAGDPAWLQAAVESPVVLLLIISHSLRLPIYKKLRNQAKPKTCINE
jgi:hypothetical protein